MNQGSLKPVRTNQKRKLFFHWVIPKVEIIYDAFQCSHQNKESNSTIWKRRTSEELLNLHNPVPIFIAQLKPQKFQNFDQSSYFQIQKQFNYKPEVKDLQRQKYRKYRTEIKRTSNWVPKLDGLEIKINKTIRIFLKSESFIKFNKLGTPTKSLPTKKT